MDRHLATTSALDGLHFAENLRWREGRLWFSDMYGDTVHAFDPTTGADEAVAELFHPAGLGWLPDGRLLAVATEDRCVFAVGPDGNELYANLTAHVPAWANEMLVDPAGRAYVGNFGYDLFGEEMRTTHLVLVQPDGTVVEQPGGLRFPNGMARRSDGRLVVAETFGACLALFDVAPDGTLSAAGTIPLGDGVTPDGICIDELDGIWVTSPMTEEAIHVDAAGVVERHAVGSPPYACMLGGPERRTLFIAVAPDHTPENRRRTAEARILSVEVDVAGIGPDGLGGGTARTSSA
jgi:sugar lactone lactonase YvrE